MKDEWYEAFVCWSREPSPTGEWVYRGQAARHRAIVPLLMRRGLRERHVVRKLFGIDYDVARALLDASPVFGAGALHPVIDDAAGTAIESLAAMLGSAPSAHPDVSFAELVRALAQHYDYPTFFIDVSFHPLVSALFASHHAEPDGCYRPSDEDGALYRWPVERRSARRCLIRGETGGERVELGVIDIREVHALARRPSTQHAALATPVHDPKPVYQPFQTPIDRLECVDMGALDCCQRFELPPCAGHTLAERTGASLTGLFPDRIDLGYSYLAVIALLSLTIHRPEHVDGEMASRLQEIFDTTVGAARALLDRECFRLAPGVDVTAQARRMSLVDVQSTIHLRAEAARRAVAYMGTHDGAALEQSLLEAKRDRQQQIATMQFRGLEEAVREVKGDAAAQALGEGRRYTVARGEHDWVMAEIDRRLARVEPILDAADWLPLWAVGMPGRQGTCGPCSTQTRHTRIYCALGAGEPVNNRGPRPLRALMMPGGSADGRAGRGWRHRDSDRLRKRGKPRRSAGRLPGRDAAPGPARARVSRHALHQPGHQRRGCRPAR